MTQSDLILKWKDVLALWEWTIITNPINPEAVTDIPNEDKYFVGVHSNHDTKVATIYHDRELTEEYILHELLNISYPDKDEDWINEKEERLLYLDREVKPILHNWLNKNNSKKK